MSHAAPGRHRAPSTAGRTPNAAVVGGLVFALVIGVATLAWWLTSRDESTTAGPMPTTSSRPATDSAQPSGAPSRVESERTVTIDGAVVTVVEKSTVVDGGAVRATPPTATPAGLQLIGASIKSADGRMAAFDSAVLLKPTGSLTVQGRYRLTSCPDVLPTQWPSPSAFPGTTRIYPRLEEPLHTAYAICPTFKTRATSLRGLSGSVGGGEAATVKLTWSGASSLTIATIGSASAVAVLVTEPGCNGGCAAQVPARGETSVTMQPVDPCPPADDSDVLTVVLEGGQIVSIRVPGLHTRVCG